MCDPGMILGLMSGAAQVAGQADAAAKNRKAIRKQAQLDYAAAERERLVTDNKANKQAYQASLEADRTASAVKAAGEGVGGSAAAMRDAEQKRQGALSIANAKDAKNAANANYAMSTKGTEMQAAHGIAQNTVNPLTAFMNIASSGLQGYGTIKTAQAH